jgi:hypothetical protein
VSPVDPGRVEHRYPVGGHVGEVVGDLDRLAGHHLLQGGDDIHLMVVEPAAQPDIAVVETDHVEALGHEGVDHSRVPGGHLGPEPVDQEQGRVLG